MHILTLQVNNFRNYHQAEIRLGDNINLIVGHNAQGKTSLLEAIYLCSVGKSARTSREKELIRYGQDAACVRLTVQSRSNLDTVDIKMSTRAPKKVLVNNIPLLRIGELMGVCNCVLFSPDELNIIKAGPSERRRFLDIALSQMSKAYFYTLQDYNKVLAQRNKLLKSNRVGASDLEIWDLQLVKVGCKVAKNRWGFVQRLSRLVQSRHQQLSSGLETLVLEYDGYDASDVDALQQQFMHDLIQDRDKDIKHGYTHSGMHKDDIAIYINGVDVRVYGSQGQQRTTVLSLKLAQIDLIYDMYQYRPILLLDDVLGELDTKRRLKLLQLCSICQTIITATHVEDVLMRALDNPKVFGIDNGQIVGD